MARAGGLAVRQPGLRGRDDAVGSRRRRVTGPGRPRVVVTVGALTVATIPAGWIVDRFDRRRTMMVADTCSAVATGSLAFAAWTGSFTLTHVLAAVTVLGTGWAVRGLAEDAALPHVVTERDLPAAFGLVEARAYAVGVAGPPVAAALYGVSAALPFAADAVSYVVAGSSVARIRGSLQESPGPDPERSDPVAITAGLRFFWRQRFLRTTAALTAVGEFVVNGCGLVAVVVLAQSGVSPAMIGVALAVAYAAGMFGSLLIPRLQDKLSPHLLLVSSAMLGAGIIAALATGSPIVVTVAFAGLLLLQPTWQIVIGPRSVRLVNDELRGRVFAAIALVTAFPVMLAPITIGLLITVRGSATTCALLGVTLAAVAVLTAVSAPVRETLRTPAPGSPGASRTVRV
ncbi:MFS transporter [Rhodococcus opacus]|nr:MFS transporter [Rhodococcus opacus]